MSASMMVQGNVMEMARHRPQPMPPGLQAIQKFGPDETIFDEGDEARCLYRVVSGMVRTCKFQSDGRRYIDAFYKAGDIFGFEMGAEHQIAAEAVTDCALVKLSRHGTNNDRTASAQLFDCAMQSLARTQAHAQLLGRGSAAQKLASFLLELLAGRAEGMVELPMARHDIADYLGLTIETVSRTLAQMERENLLELITARKLRLLNRAALAELCA